MKEEVIVSVTEQLPSRATGVTEDIIRTSKVIGILAADVQMYNGHTHICSYFHIHLYTYIVHKRMSISINFENS